MNLSREWRHIKAKTFQFTSNYTRFVNLGMSDLPPTILNKYVGGNFLAVGKNNAVIEVYEMLAPPVLLARTCVLNEAIELVSFSHCNFSLVWFVCSDHHK